MLLLLMVSVIGFGCQQSFNFSDEKDAEQQDNTEEVDEDSEESQNELSEQKPVGEGDEENNKNGEEETSEQANDEEGSDEKAQKDEPVHGEKNEEGLVVVDNPESLEVLVNKQRKLPDGYQPENLVVPDVPFSFEEDAEKKQMRQVAASALEELFQAAQQEEVELLAASGYRSFQTQTYLYESYVEKDGQEAADRYSARPGTSEHQTGLTMDLTSAEMAFQLDQSFKNTTGGAWLADHAHEFGFIIRYPEGKEDITGYMYEPWHIRYVGKEMATEIYEENLTLEEYLGYGYEEVEE